MKEDQLREHANCDICKKGIGHTGMPLFYTVKIERWGIDIQAVKRQDGLAAHMGSGVLAAIMGPNETMAKPMMQPVELTVCEECGTSRGIPVAALAMES